jgi:Peptidase family M28/PDZ domain/PA domain
MPKSITLYLITSFLVLIAFLSTSFAQDNPIDDIQANLEYIAADTLEGRYPISEGNFVAAEYIAQKFEEYGIGQYNDSYFQNFLFPGAMVTSDDSKVEFKVYIPRPGVPKKYIKPVTKKWEMDKDWFPMRFSGSGNVSGELVFVGHGISSANLGYDDYAGIDVKDKIVIILADSSEKFPRDDFFGQFSELKYKAENAKEHGAKALIFVKSQSDSANNHYPFYPEIGYLDAGIVAIQANRTSLAHFFPKKKQLSQIELNIFKTRKPNSFIIENAEIVINLTLERKEIEIPNVVAMVKGSSNPDNYVIIGAHLDHVGREKNETFYWQPLWEKRKYPIHNGADDNASGVAAMMELARRIHANPIDKTVLFVAFNANEQNLAGSKAFLELSGIDKSKIDFVINLDMVGHMSGNKLNALGAETSDELKSLLNKAALDDSTAINFPAGGYDLSDEHTFFVNKIPAVRLATEHHLDYHTPYDDASKISIKGIRKVVGYCETMLRLSEGLDMKYSTANLSHPVSSFDRIGHQAWLGILPVFVLHTEGFRIAGVADKSPARKAGFHRNDVITHINGKRIYSFADYSEELRKLKAGDAVSITYKRKGKENEKKVTLGER